MFGAFFVVVTACVAADAAPTIDVKPAIGLWIEEDTNPRRVAEKPVDDDDADPTAIVPDGLLRAAFTLDVAARAPGRLLRVDSAVGGKLFFTAATERMLVAQTRATAAAAVDDVTSVIAGASAKLRLQRSGVRNYGNFRGDLSVERVLGAGFSVRGGVDGASFLALDNALFSFAGGGLLGAVRFQHEKEHVELVVDAGVRGFPFAAPDDAGGDERRVDAPLVASLNATSARRLYLAATYTLVRNQSTARGEAYTRQRAQLTGGARLPAQVTATAQLALQLTSYDDGLSLGQQYFLADDDETQNVVEVALSRPLFGGLIFEARAGFLSNELAQDGARFSRATAALGLRLPL